MNSLKNSYGFVGRRARAVLSVAVIGAAVLCAVPANASETHAMVRAPLCSSGSPGHRDLGLLGIMAPRGGEIHQCSGANVMVHNDPVATRGGTPPLLFDRFGSSGQIAGNLGDPGNVTVTPIFWNPPGDPTFAKSYTSQVTQFLGDLAASDPTTNVMGVLNQYNDGSSLIHAHFHLGTPIYTSDPVFNASADSPCPVSPGGIYANGDPYVDCVSSVQIEVELSNIAAKQGLPVNDGHIYPVFLPRQVEVCDSQITLCTPTPGAKSAFCAYHSSTGFSNGVLYTAQPYPVVGASYGTCGMGSSPNNNPDADAALNGLSHELAETVTDPYGFGWRTKDRTEIGDLCNFVTPDVMAKTSSGQFYDQVINGHPYLLQDEFSNIAFAHDPAGGCEATPTFNVQRLTFVAMDTTSLVGSAGDTLAIPVTVASWNTSPGAPAPTGTITVDDGTDHCTAVVSGTNGAASGRCNLSVTVAGPAIAFTGTYSGSSAFDSSTTGASAAIAAALPVISLSVSKTPTVGAPVVITATVKSPIAAFDSQTPSGYISIDDSFSSCDVLLAGAGGVASGSCTFSDLPAGPSDISSTYKGDNIFSGNISDPFSINVAKATPVLTVGVPAVSTPNQSVLVRATLTSPGAGIGSSALVPGGTVAMSLGGRSCILALVGADGVSTGTCAVAFPTNGTKTVTGVYHGDPNFNAVVGTANIVVTQSATTLRFIAPPTNASVGAATKLSVSVSGPTAGPAPTGSVTITLGGGTCTALLGGSHGVALGSCVVAPKSSGAAATATYSGALGFAPSTATTPVKVLAAGTTTALTASLTQLKVGHIQLEHFSVHVSNKVGLLATGTVSIFDGKTSVCTAVLSKGLGQCSPSATGLVKGVHHLVAVFTATPALAGSQSALVVVTVS